jgi:hypothetical protein
MNTHPVINTRAITKLLILFISQILLPQQVSQINSFVFNGMEEKPHRILITEQNFPVPFSVYRTNSRESFSMGC